jgi:hypothetical protein
MVRTSIPGFWDIGPHEPLSVEETWNEFVHSSGGIRISELLSKNPDFENADYFFKSEGVIAELKEIETEFGSGKAFHIGYEALIKRLMAEDPYWRPELLGGNGVYPNWFYPEFVRLFRPPISRVLKKANRQIRQTKDYLGITEPKGILLFVNDGFTSIGPDILLRLVCEILMNSYSSIDCFLYLTVNRYIEIKDSDMPSLVWIPIYSIRGEDLLHDFINDLGSKWFKYLESKIGPWTVDPIQTENIDIIRGSKAIIFPKS